MAFSLDFKGGNALRQIPLSKIYPNPYQPRRIFDTAALNELADSIRRLGIITPLTVRREGEGYMLISGERRLRASKIAGLEKVPCYVIEADDKKVSAMALAENLQRRDLDPFEEAEGLLKLTTGFGLTQAAAAELVGKTQAAVANKLRLLKLFPKTVEIIRREGLSERHGRALLALDEEARQVKAAEYIAKRHMTVAAAESYIKSLISPKERPRKQVYIKDIRFFINSVSNAVQKVRQAGIDAECVRSEGEGFVRLVITLPSLKKQ